MPDSTDDHPLEKGDPRTTREILEAMVERTMEGFEAAVRAFTGLEEILVDMADAMEAMEKRLAALEGQKKVTVDAVGIVREEK